VEDMFEGILEEIFLKLFVLGERPTKHRGCGGQAKFILK